MIILLLGPQGSGKGTQGELLSKELGIPLLSTGALLREEIATGSDLGKEMSALMDAGNLVSPDLATRIISERLKKTDALNGALVDGYPRDGRQLEMMFEHFTPSVAIVLDIDDDTAVDRLGGRWVCPDGHIWNINSNQPKKNGLCDNDNKKLFQRADDTENAILQRLAVYHKETAPLITELARRGVKVVRVDASGTIEEIQDKIKSLIK